MITREVTVKSAEWADTKDGSRQYLSAVLVNIQNGKESKQSIFDPPLQKTIQTAHKEGQALQVKMEKEGQFWNVKGAEVIETPTPTETPPKPDVQRYTGRDEDAVDARTCLMQACDLYKFQNQGTPSQSPIDFKELGLIATRLQGILTLLRTSVVREKK